MCIVGIQAKMATNCLKLNNNKKYVVFRVALAKHTNCGCQTCCITIKNVHVNFTTLWKWLNTMLLANRGSVR